MDGNNDYGSPKTVNGDVTINGDASGEFTLNEGLNINGHLIVNTPNKTVNNNANVEDDINIQNVSGNTWNENVWNNSIIVNDKSEAYLNLNKEASNLTLNEPTTVKLGDYGIFNTIEVNANSTIISETYVRANIKEGNKVTFRLDEDDEGTTVIGSKDTHFVNLKAFSTIQRYAKNNDASALTQPELEEASSREVIGDNLEAYKNAIAKKDSIPDKKSLQTLVLDVNKNEALKTIQKYAEHNDAYGLNVEQLETAGVEHVNGDKLETYKTAISNEDSIADLEALQTVISNVNNATLFKKSNQDFEFIKMGDNLYEVNSDLFPYYMGEIKTNNNKYVTGRSEIDIYENSIEDLVIRVDGIFSLLMLGAQEFNIEESENPYLDGKITFDTFGGSSVHVTKEDLKENTDFSIGYEKYYESATEVVEERWIEYKGKKFENPTEYNDKFPHMVEYNDVPFFAREKYSRSDLDVSINDMFEYLNMNAEISFGQDKDRNLSYLEIKYN